MPWDCLVPELKGRVLSAFYPTDRPDAGGWLHVVGGSAARPETLWQIAERFTGDGSNFRLLRSRNRLGDEDLVVGQEVLVPAAILIEPFRGASQVAALDAGTRDLTYASDAEGAYAVYELKPGEALYSSVVVRFTGRLFAADVNPLAQEIARRSGIADVTEIPVGYQVKVPLDLLLPEYLPRDNPRRVEYEEGLSRSAQFSNSVRRATSPASPSCSMPGTVGGDVGATSGGVWESLYVYDIMLRVRKELLARTAAKVVPTTRNGSDFTIENADVLSFSKEHEVRTTPPYPITDAKVGVGLRWYLANSVVDDRKPEQTIFLSIHADSLHPSVRGAMVYVPGLLPIPSRYGLSAAVYTQRAEVRSRPTVSFTKQERVKSEGLSRDLANKIIAGFRGKKIGIHPNKPVRDRIVRRRGTAVGARGAPLQRGSCQGSRRGVQSRQRRGSTSDPDTGVPAACRRGPGPGDPRLLRRVPGRRRSLSSRCIALNRGRPCDGSQRPFGKSGNLPGGTLVQMSEGRSVGPFEESSKGRRGFAVLGPRASARSSSSSESPVVRTSEEQCRDPPW